MSAPATLVVGAGGLLGQAVVRQLASTGTPVSAARVRWTDGLLAVEDVVREVSAHVHGAGNGPWAIIWCAGAGVTSTGRGSLLAELSVVDAFVAHLGTLPGQAKSRGTVFFASSAGGVYAGGDEPPFSEASPTAPLAAYGEAKLEAESRMAALASHGYRVILGRISNIYGPGQNLAKPQGLISQLCLSHHRATPLGIYVSLDTLRDYLYVDDCASLVTDTVVRIQREPAGTSVVKILASHSSVSIAGLLGHLRMVHKKRPQVILAASPYARQQARDLRFRSEVWPELSQRSLTPIVVGIAATSAAVGRYVRSGAA